MVLRLPLKADGCQETKKSITNRIEWVLFFEVDQCAQRRLNI